MNKKVCKSNESVGVYAIGGGKYIKFGVSKNPKRRLRELQTGNPIPLSILGYGIHENSYELEKEIHKYLSPFRAEGEWFNKEDIPNDILSKIMDIVCHDWERYIENTLQYD